MKALMLPLLGILILLGSCQAPTKKYAGQPHQRPTTTGDLCDALRAHLRSAREGIIRGDTIVASRSKSCGESELWRVFRDGATPNSRVYFANGARFLGFIRLQVVADQLVNVSFQEGNFEVRTGRECHFERLE